MVRLDDMRFAGFGAGRLDDVRVDCSLGKPFYALELMCLFVEYIDKQPANNLSFFFRVLDTLRAVKNRSAAFTRTTLICM